MDRVQQCYYCDTDLMEDWNLFPIGANEDNTKRLYDWDKVVCDDCYDEHCTQWDIQPLEGE
jgi:hypothetical protein